MEDNRMTDWNRDFFLDGEYFYSWADNDCSIRSIMDHINNCEGHLEDHGKLGLLYDYSTGEQFTWIIGHQSAFKKDQANSQRKPGYSYSDFVNDMESLGEEDDDEDGCDCFNPKCYYKNSLKCGYNF